MFCAGETRTKHLTPHLFEKIQKIALLILSSFLFLAGCSPLVQLEQPSQTGFVTLKEGESAGQTFVARYDGLEPPGSYNSDFRDWDAIRAWTTKVADDLLIV